MNNFKLPFVYLLFIFIIFMFSITPSRAASITVSGACTLADAITSANTDTATGSCTAGSGADVITLTADVTLTTTNNTTGGRNGLPVVSSDITIEGAGFTIQRNSATCTNVTNSISNGDFRIFYVTGTLTLNDATVRYGCGNETDNQTSSGGGIANVGGTLNINNSTITNNYAIGGGGIWTDGAATTNIYQSTITNNAARGSINWGYGGGIYLNNIGGNETSTMNITNSTISGNTSNNSGGGYGQDGTASTANIRNTAFYGNDAGDGNGAHLDIYEGTINLNNSILTGAAAAASDCLDSNNAAWNGTNNLVDDNASGGCSTLSSAAVTNIDGTLALNGGTTMNHALLTGSNAIDAGAACAGSPVNGVDQRDVSRDATCDIGSYEYVNPQTVTVQFSAATANSPEATGTVPTLTITTSDNAVTASAVTVQVNATGGTATGGGTDYSLSGTITIPAGTAHNGTVSVSTLSIVDDGLMEVDETINLQVVNVSGATIGAQSTHIYTITDDESATVAFQNPTSSVFEAVTTVNVPVVLTITTTTGTGQLSGVSVTVDVTDAGGGSATSGTDYTALGTQTLTFASGTNTGATQNAMVDVQYQAALEGNETVQLQLGNVGNATITGTNPHELTISDLILSMTKSFTDDPVGATGTVTLEFTITNNTASQVSDISFTDDLDAVISGLVATALPASDVCGLGSTLSGTSIISLTSGEIAASGSCTFSVSVSVPVTATAGTYTNTTSDILVSGVVSGNAASDTLTIEPPPSFSKGFSPSPIVMGGVSTLTLTIDNSGSAIDATSLDFTDNLPSDLLIATPANASTTCTGGTLTAADGTSTITYTGGSITAGTSCTVTVDVTSAIAGTYANTTGDLTSSSGNSGTASANLVVADELAISKSFTNDPVLTSGGTVTLEFTILNPDTVNGASNVAFSDDLTAVLTGLEALSVDSNTCGGTVDIAAPTLIDFSGGSLGANSNCVIQVSLDVPASSAGSYPNTTTAITGDVGGIGITGNAATDDLLIEAPVAAPPTPTPAPPQSSIGTIEIFDPAISKLGFLVPGQVGVTGEQLEWIVTVSNPSNVTGINVIITDDIDPRLQVNSVDAPGATVTITGQNVTVVYAAISPGESKIFSIFTTVLDGIEVDNTACVTADNQGTEECFTGTALAELPTTGETPLLRYWILLAAGGLILLSSGMFLISNRNKS